MPRARIAPQHGLVSATVMKKVRALLRGQALVGAVNCTDALVREIAQLVSLWPTFIDAGGESLSL